MRERTVCSLLVFGCLILTGSDTSAWAQDFEESPVDSTLATAFDDLADSLETRTAAQSVWEFPFAAPQPSELDSKDLETVLTLRRLARTRNLPELESLVDRVARRGQEMPVQMRFWLAYSLGLLHRNEACLANLTRLLTGYENLSKLENGQLAWVLTGTCDNLFLLERRQEAGRLYRRLASSPLPQLNLWGNYQLAGMDFLARNFAEADRRYGLVCESEKSGTWREHACEMATIAGQLATLRTEGMGHGISANVVP